MAVARHTDDRINAQERNRGFADFLTAMEHHAPTTRLTRVNALHPTDVRTIPDRIEAGTFLVAAAMAGDPSSSVRVEACNPSHLSVVLEKLKEAGAAITVRDSSVEVRPPEVIRPVSVTTGVYPGFPTDMQAQWIALCARHRGRA
jgi:UDP-N-acetylglucosamine 1-carboxyvinyltransferase